MYLKFNKKEWLTDTLIISIGLISYGCVCLKDDNNNYMYGGISIREPITSINEI